MSQLFTPATQTSGGLFGVIGQGNNNGFTSASTNLFGVPAAGRSGTSSFTFGQPLLSAFGTPYTGFSQTSSSLSSAPTPFGTPSTGFSQNSTSVFSAPTSFGTPSTGFSQNLFSAPTAFGTPSTGFSQNSTSLFSAPTAFGTPSTGFSQNSTSVFSAPTAFGTPSTGFSQNSTSVFSAPTAFGTPSTGFSQSSASVFSAPTVFGTPSSSGFSQSSLFSAPTAFGTPSSGFSQSSASVFSAPTAFGTPSSSGFSQSSLFSAPTAFGPPSSTGFSQSSSSLFSAPTSFGTPSVNPFNQTGTSSAFSFPQTPFGPSSTTRTPTPFGTPSSPLTSFGIPSVSPFNQTGTSSAFSFTQTPFGPSSTTGTPSPSYAPTTITEEATGGKQVAHKLISISAMPAYVTRSHEELRWDNYMNGKTSGKTTAPSNPFNINSKTSWPSTATSPTWNSSSNTALTTTPSNLANPVAINSTTSWPSTTTSPTWNSSSNTALTTTPSNLANPFAINPLVKSTSSGFAPGSSMPVTTSWQTTTTSPAWTTAPSNPFGPMISHTSQQTSTFPFTPLGPNPFQISSTSLPTQSTSPSFPSPTYPLNAAVPTPSYNQMPLPQVTSTSAAAASPFGILPPSPRLSFSRSTPIQYGISSIPVKDKPAPVRYPLLTTRIFSRGGKLPIRKYDPKSSGPKIPFYNVTNEMPDTFFVPRENPRALIITRENSPPRENMHEEKLSGSVYEKERDGTSADTSSEDPTDDQNLFATIFDVPSKLKQPDYYTQPQISELEAKERVEPGYCRRVKDFVVGRHGYGSIKFIGETDVRKLDLESLIQFNNREVIVYMDESKKPPVGEGLNIPAEITLLNIKCVNKKTGVQCVDGLMVDRYTAMLKKKAATQGVEFLSYDPVEGEWKFKVQHF